MRAEKVIIAFKNDTVSENVSRMLKSGGINTTVTCSTAAEIRKQCLYLGEGIIICGYSFADSSIMTLIDDIPESFNVILIGKFEQICMCDDERIFKLAVPLKREDLIYSVSMMMNFDESGDYHKPKIKSDEKNELIEEAKRVLIDKYDITEEQAHRYIQKKSMDTGRKIVDIARAILD
ncbi:MAG: ANTAR domain-containing protein [Firmicutes bacterium]|nr:ANTAR domain-containing protein [Bacillota bacterium]